MKALICLFLCNVLWDLPVWWHVLLYVSLSIWLNDVKDTQTFLNWRSLNIFKQHFLVVILFELNDSIWQYLSPQNIMKTEYKADMLLLCPLCIQERLTEHTVKRQDTPRSSLILFLFTVSCFLLNFILYWVTVDTLHFYFYYIHPVSL